MPPASPLSRCSRRAFSPTFDRLTGRSCETGSGNFQLSRFFPFMDRSAVSIVPRNEFLFSCTCIHHDSHIPRPSSSTRPRRTRRDETYLMDGCKCRLWLFSRYYCGHAAAEDGRKRGHYHIDVSNRGNENAGKCTILLFLIILFLSQRKPETC
jgi:hypothetical protein